MSKYDELKRLAEAECISSELGSFENPHLCAAILELIADNERNERMLLAACVDMGAIGEALGADMNSDGEEMLSMVVEMKAEREALLAERDALKKDAERYRWLRIADWWNSPLCVIRDPKQQAKPGADCPSRDRLDEAIDAALQGAQP